MTDQQTENVTWEDGAFFVAALVFGYLAATCENSCWTGQFITYLLSAQVLFRLAVKLYRSRGKGSALSNIKSLWPVVPIVGASLICPLVHSEWAWLPVCLGLIFYLIKG